MHITFEDYVNPKVINIFTDASMWLDNNDTGCYGFITLHGETEINSGVFIDTNSTNNRCEIKGVKMGVLEAIRLRNQGFKGTINLFCDSQVAVCGIRDWIFGWNYNGADLVSKNGSIVANQSEYIEIMQLIIANNPNINFYNQKGHVNISNKNDLKHAIRIFTTVNFLNPNDIYVDFQLMKFLCGCNNEVDNRTRWHLRKQADLSNQYRDAFKFAPKPTHNKDLHEYNMITGRTHNA